MRTYIATVIVILVAWSALVAADDASLPRLATMPDFTLCNRDGRVVHKPDLVGRVWIMDFIFTSCTQYCQMMTYQLNQMRKQLVDDAGIGFISVSVDPEHDRPAVLEKYAEDRRAVADNWFFLTGNRDDLLNVMRTLSVVPKNATDWNAGMHTTFFILLDKNATVRGFYERGAEDAQRTLMRDARVLVREGATPTPSPTR